MQGWTYEDIAAEYGVTVSAVNFQLQAAGATSKRPSHKNLIPWTVRAEHAHARPASMLRVLGRRERGDESIPAAKERMLNKWLRELREADVVVCYHRDMPPNAASPKVGGWYYSTRRESDGDSLIRFEELDYPPPITNRAAMP